MKQCTRCEHDFEIDEFPIVNKKTGKRSALCSECKKAYDREHYAKHKDTRVERKREVSRNQRTRNLQFVIDYLKKHPCKDCGEDDFIVLEFDHKGDKEHNVSDMVRYGFSLENIQKEIDKCDVVCRNCHKRRTAKQFGYYRNIEGEL